METQQQALLGILGGMGPLATVDFLNKLTRLTPAGSDQEHLPWVTLSQPRIPDRSTAIKNGTDDPAPYLTSGVAWLADQGVSLIAIPCNTSHYWYEQMRAHSRVPILHIADATIEELQCRDAPVGPVAILATRGTVQAGIYSQRLQAHGYSLAPLTEDDQCVVDAVIHSVKAGQVGTGRDQFRALLGTLVGRGVYTLILGCTELPLAYPVRSGDAPAQLQAIDTTLALASASLRQLGYL